MSSHNMGSVHRRYRVRSLARRDGNLCHWCKCDFTEQRPRTMDHLILRSAGGSNALSNLVLACRPCNEQRGDQHLAAWLSSFTQATHRDRPRHDA